MTYLFLGGAALLGLFLLFRWFQKADLRRLVRSLRWVTGGGLALLSVFLLLRGQVAAASLTGPAAFSILKFGRLGPLIFENLDDLSADNESAVRSRFIAMTLDHDSGAVEGRVVAGAFKGADLLDLGEEETRQLLAEVSADPDSLALLETWLDKNRAGWREYFAGDAARPEAAQVDLDEEAYQMLGLKPGASADDIHEAHRRLMKRVHPDQGGSTYLASKINAAKDRLLRKMGAK